MKITATQKPTRKLRTNTSPASALQYTARGSPIHFTSAEVKHCFVVEPNVTLLLLINVSTASEGKQVFSPSAVKAKNLEPLLEQS